MHLHTRNVNTAFRELVTIFRDGEKFSTSYQSLGGPCSVVKRPSRNGNVLMIDEPVTITYEKPKERVLLNQARDANPFFHLYESLWMLAGRNDVAPLAYYNKRMAEFSDDGKTFNGAYGYRWRNAFLSSEGGGYNDTDQLSILVNHLKADPNSRRAVLQMWNVEDDLLKINNTRCETCDGTGEVHSHNPKCWTCHGSGVSNRSSKDVCCNLSVMFSQRDEPDGNRICTGPERFLDMTVTNRSNDLIWGCLGGDFTTFSFLQEYVAARLGVEVGRYHQITNNLHVYDWNWKPEEWLNVPYFSYEDANLSNSGLDINADKTYMARLWGRDSSKWRIPLVKNLETFERELPRFVETYSGESPSRTTWTDWSEPFFFHVAEPMMQAFYCYKQKQLELALQTCENIRADDWRIAATNWITKRIKK